MNGFVASLPAEKSPSWAELGLELLTREPKPNERILYTIYDECTQYGSEEYATDEFLAQLGQIRHDATY